MKCLYCGKNIDSPTEVEKKDQWHKRCAKKFFDLDRVPELDISNTALSVIVTSTIKKGFTVPGVQKKMSLHLSKEDKPRLTLVDYPTGYILKPQTEEFEKIPEAEMVVMSMAECCGIQVVPHALLKMEDTYAYITKRVDRIGEVRVAMEDFAQLGHRLTKDKYRGSYERCAEIIKRYSNMPGMDLSEFFLRIVFSFVTGNSDMHLKNFSMLEMTPGSRVYRLSPAYDLLPVNVLMPEDQDQTALTVGGKKRNLKRNDFLRLSDTIGIPKRAAERMIDHIINKQKNLEKMVWESELSEEQKNAFQELIRVRIDSLVKHN